jgi:hypothetical protein
MDEGRPGGVDDTGGPSSHCDEDQPVPHDGGDATRANDEAARNVAKGCSDPAVDEQSREL